MHGHSAHTSKESNRFIGNRLWVLLAVIAASAIHALMGTSGLINISAAVALPVMCAFITLIIYGSFTAMHKSGNYGMLAGYNRKKDDLNAVQRQMYWIEKLTAYTSLLFEALFAAVYFVPAKSQMKTTEIMLFAYVGIIALCILGVNLKIKTRKR